MYNKFVALLRASSLGKKLIDVLWPFKRKVDFFAKWVLFGRNQNVIMRSDPMFRQGLLDLIDSLSSESREMIMVEIGSYKGESAELFLSTGCVSKIYCVDPWKPFYDSSDAASFTDMVKVEATFDKRFACDSRVIKVKGTIDTFVENYVKSGVVAKVDLIYIDGNHTRSATLHDIDMSMNYIKPRLAISGHDYGSDNGVLEAVDARLGKPDRLFSDTSWIKFLGGHDYVVRTT